MHIHMYIYTYMYICININRNMNISIYIYMYVCIYAHMHICICEVMLCVMHVCTCAGTCACICFVYTCVRRSIYVYTFMCMRMYSLSVQPHSQLNKPSSEEPCGTMHELCRRSEPCVRCRVKVLTDFDAPIYLYWTLLDSTGTLFYLQFQLAQHLESVAHGV